MRIQFERMGGFVGRHIAVTIDLESLTPQDKHELRELVETSGFFDLATTLEGPTPGGDRFVYRLTVESSGRRHTVEVIETAVPSSLRPLLGWLTTAARRGQGGLGRHL